MKHRFCFIALLAFIPIWSAHAQQLTTLHAFNNADGYLPFAGVTVGDDGNFYGVTEQGGDFAMGVAFRITPSGSFTLLHSFGQNSTDPQHPHATLIKGNDGNFYGVTVHGGTSGNGTIYKMTPDGQVTVLHSMSLTDGTHPDGPLLLAPDGNFYGTAPAGGGSGGAGTGTVFKMTPDGTLTVLHSFSGTFGGANTDGADPEAGLTLGPDGNFYGTTAGGGNTAFGTAFVVTTNGGFTTIHTFGSDSQNLGAHPVGNLTLGSDNSFYGTCANDVVSGTGIIFKMSTSGTVQTLYHFLNSSTDGSAPHGTLLLGSDGNFYGTASGGGAAGAGSLFKITPTGAFTLLYSFTGNQTNATDGANPWAGVVQGSDGGLYGTTTAGGGSNNVGTIFKFGGAVTPPAPSPAKISVTYEGKVRDRVSKADNGVSPDGQPDATFTVTLQPGSGARQVTSIDLNRGDGNDWDTTPANAQWVVGAASTLDSTLLNNPNGSVTFSVADGASFEIFASENGNLFSTGTTFTITLSFADKTTAAATVIIPPTNGLAPVSFTVNGSSSPAYPPTGTTVNGLADTVLQFAAQEIGNAAGLILRVQATTTPGVASSWTNLPTSSGGVMSYDATTNRYILNTTDYQHDHTDPVYFRAVSYAQGYDPVVSNVVGPFNLTSDKSRLTTTLFFAANGPLADFYFRAIPSNVPSGTSVRVQSSTDPGNESAWQDLAVPGSGVMNRSTNAAFPNDFLLLLDQLPTTTNLYFRAIASGATGYVDSISNVVGPFDITADKPPQVGVIPPGGLAGSGDGHDVAKPILVPAGTVNFAATAGGGDRAIQSVHLLVNGAQVGESNDPNAQVYFGSFTAQPGVLYVLEGIAFDDLGAHARAGSSAVFIRAVSSNSNALAVRRSDFLSPLVTSGGRFYHAAVDGAWDDEATWTDENDQHGIPTDADAVDIGAHAIQLRASAQVGSITINGGTLFGRGNFTVWDGMTVGSNGCSIQGGIIIIIQHNAVWTLLNDKDITFDSVATYFLSGKMNIHGTGSIVKAADVTSQGLINWQALLAVPPDAAVNPAAGTRVLSSSTLTDGGIINGSYQTLIGHDGGSLIGHDGGSLIGHDGGSLIGHDGGSVIAQGGGNVIAQGGGNVIAQGGGNVIAQGGGNVIAQGGGNVIATGGGNVIAAGGGNFQRSANTRADAVAAGYVKTAGELNLSSTFVVGNLTLNGGVLSGSGLVLGDLSNNGGYITPGGSSAPGQIAVTGNFTQTTNGTIIVERAGANAGEFDQVQVGGTASLDGKLDVKNVGGYNPDVSDTFNPIGYESVTGSFSSISSNAQITFNSTGAIATVDPSAPPPKAAQPLNISTRMQVLAGDNALIAGFIVTGPAGSTKKVLVRGLGPSLANFGVPGTISDPLLELHEADGTVVTNDDWQQGDTSQIPSGFAPSDPRESLIVATLSPGNYSAVLKGAHGETGVGIAEVYDLDSGSTAQLANISTRGFVNTGDNVMIGGFIISGTEPTRVLVRAVGPSLTAFGVQGALPATTLELHDANGAVISNEGWRNTQEADIAATGIQPSDDNEAAILATLVPGNYTAVVRGKNNTTGIGLVEAYNLQ